jgi:hypothetical protein
MTTPIFHASVAGISGLAFQLADRFYRSSENELEIQGWLS